jgi:hypothetical protein
MLQGRQIAFEQIFTSPPLSPSPQGEGRIIKKRVFAPLGLPVSLSKGGHRGILQSLSLSLCQREKLLRPGLQYKRAIEYDSIYPRLRDGVVIAGPYFAKHREDARIIIEI